MILTAWILGLATGALVMWMWYISRTQARHTCARCCGALFGARRAAS